MKRVFKKIMIVLLVCIALCATGCDSQSAIEITSPTVGNNTYTDNTSGMDGGVGLTAGFEMKYDAGLIDNSDSEVNMYDDRFYYMNQIRESGADPGVCFVS